MRASLFSFQGIGVILKIVEIGSKIEFYCGSCQTIRLPTRIIRSRSIDSRFGIRTRNRTRLSNSGYKQLLGLAKHTKVSEGQWKLDRKRRALKDNGQKCTPRLRYGSEGAVDEWWTFQEINTEHQTSPRIMHQVRSTWTKGSRGRKVVFFSSE